MLEGSAPAWPVVCIFAYAFRFLRSHLGVSDLNRHATDLRMIAVRTARRTRFTLRRASAQDLQTALVPGSAAPLVAALVIR